MSHGSQSYLRFSIEESVWFQKGQEVDDLLSISLDPNITILESDQYITIKGALELTGEYTREVIDTSAEEDYFNNPRRIQIVEVREEGLHLFSHEFPVEVTIPKSRIEDIRELDVFVETFDYDFPEKSCLRLSADLTITGLYGEQSYDFYSEEQVELEEYTDLPQEREDEEDRWNPANQQDDQNEVGSFFSNKTSSQNEIFQPFTTEAGKASQDEEEVPITLEKVQEEFEDRVDDQDEFISSPSNKTSPQDEIFQPFTAEARKPPQDEEEIPITVEKEQEEFESRVDEPVEIIPEITFLAKRHEEGPAVSPVNEVIKEEVEVIEENEASLPQGEVIENVESEIAPQEEEIPEEEIEEESEQPKGKKKNKKIKKKQSLTLSEFFARKEEEEHTRLKICIVQSGETLDLLSERYDVPSSQIQRENGLELNQDIYEGQVLYIPGRQTQR